MDRERPQTEFGIDPESGELAGANTEQTFRQWSLAEDLRHFRHVVVVVSALFVSFLIVDYAAAGLSATFYWGIAARATVLLLGFFCYGRLGRVESAEELDRVAITFAVGAEIASFAIFALTEQSPVDLRIDELTVAAQMVMVAGVYLFLPSSFRVQAAIGWTSAAIDVLLLATVGDAAPPGRIVSRAMFLLLANALGMLLSSRLQRLRRLTYAELVEEQRTNSRLSLEVARRATSEEQKDRMFSIIAHDLRAPFSVLLGFASILRDEAAELSREQIERYSRSVHANGVRVLGLLDNMLQWARLQMKRVKIVPSVQPLHPLVEQLLSELSDAALAKEITLGNRVGDLWVEADVILITTTLRNLVTNGIKFTPPGGKVEVRAEAERDTARIEVVDTGVGIEASRLARLFEPGGQRATPGTNGEAGTGLGLLICKDLIELHGSQLEVESAPGSGATFRFRLPLRESRGDAASAHDAVDPDQELGRGV